MTSRARHIPASAGLSMLRNVEIAAGAMLKPGRARYMGFAGFAERIRGRHVDNC